MKDVERQGWAAVVDDHGMLPFLDFETGREVSLPRNQIAVIQDVLGGVNCQTVCIPAKLAREMGLI